MIRRIIISLTIVFFAICCGAVLLFNWSALGWKALSVPTGSMRPSISPGSLVLMHSVSNASLKVGDVITYANPLKPGTTITHRIIEINKIGGKIPSYVTKGDANPTADRPIVGGQVLGKTVLHVPYVGSWLSWGKTWLGIVFLVYIPALLLMIEEVKRLNRYYKVSKPYKSFKLIFKARQEHKPRPNLASASTISVAVVAVPVLVAFPVHALLKSNTVSLVNNRITVRQNTPPPNQCTGNNTNVSVNGSGSSNNNSVIIINNSNNQTSTSGNATSNGGSASSGNASNTNCTNININVNQH
jgi:signal peptidase